MNVLVVTALAAALCLVLPTRADVGRDSQEWPQTFPKMDWVCLGKHCSVQSGSCLLESGCREAVECSMNCMRIWDNDSTPEKYHVQNCTNICAFSYRNKPYELFMGCLSDYKCLTFPTIPSKCRAPGNLTTLKKLSTKDLEGAWWVVRGSHPVYDCYPCQHLFFKQLNATSWSYLPKYQVYVANKSLTLITDEYVIPDSTPGSEISFAYSDVGLVHYENWWLIDGAKDLSYVLLYYCGNTLQWYYDGALVLARNSSLPASDYSAIAESYSKAVGLDTSKFCNTTVKQCPD